MRLILISLAIMGFLSPVPKVLAGDAPAASVVLMLAEDEYKTEISVPAFAKDVLAPLGINCTTVEANPPGGMDFPGIERALPTADLLLISVRRRTPTTKQLQLIRDHITAGKPMVGIRTASHAFALRKGTPTEGHAEWKDFDSAILGGSYDGHFGNEAAILSVAAGAAQHPILRGVDLTALPTYRLYKNLTLGPQATALVTGMATNSKDIHHVAWCNQVGTSRIFYTSLGSVDDFQQQAFKTLLKNGVLWALGREPMAGALKKNDRQQGELTVQAGFTAEVVLREPQITKPVFLNFDERGRMWVVEYRQYPDPTGLTRVSHDQFWRSVYDKVPSPPPRHVHGRDRISVWSCSKDDGVFDQQRIVFDDLNIATAIEHGRGGMWVLNPPYLLFYPDANRDDVPDGDPVVHLAGFGLEDTHSVANSLRWGPDGWLYGAVGSTVTADIIRPGMDESPIMHIQGQGIWRYHPATRAFEMFAEGGGNTFGVEMDDVGQIFSGHNGSGTRGFHYIQGAYEQKGFDKHGPLSNPSAFGYFRPMATANRISRFSHNLIMYGGGVFPEVYQGKMFSIDPLNGTVILSTVSRDGSTYRTEDAPSPFVSSNNKLFRPVDIKVGPDGALYICDWRDLQVTHFRNHEGKIDHSLGHIWRIRSDNTASATVADLGAASSAELLALLAHPNRWYRQTALRVIGDRRDPSLYAPMQDLLNKESGQTALEALWALHQSGGLDHPATQRALSHTNPQVRAWTVRMSCDSGTVTSAIANDMAIMAKSETELAVRVQLACSARRLSLQQGFPTIRALMTHDGDSVDKRQPLNIWWAIEKWITSDRTRVMALVSDPSMWSTLMMRDHLAERIMRRLMTSGTTEDMVAAAAFLNAAPDPTCADAALRGFSLALAGRPLPSVPAVLQEALDRRGGGPLPLALRAGRPEAITKGLQLINDDKADHILRLQCLEALGDVAIPQAIPVLLHLLKNTNDTIAIAAAGALQRYDEASIAEAALALRTKVKPNVQVALENLLASRASSAWVLVKAVQNGDVSGKSVDAAVVRRLLVFDDQALKKAVEKAFQKPGRATTAAMESEITRIQAIVQVGGGDPAQGQMLFQSACGTCHKMYDQGGFVGPDLTGFKRDDLATLLLSIINPSAEIREGYESQAITTNDGRALFGFLASEDKNVIVMRGLDGQTTTIARDAIATRSGSAGSLMPEGLLMAYSEEQLRDLFSYLRLTQPLPARKSR